MKANWSPEEMDKFVEGALNANSEATQAEVSPMLAELRERNSRTLFYPAAMKDWTPLHWFSRVELGFDTFVFCDQGLHRPSLENLRSPDPGMPGPLFLKPVSSLSLQSEFEIGALSRPNQTQFEALVRDAVCHGRGDWFLQNPCKGYRVEIEIDQPSRQIVLFYVACDAVACFYRLYSSAGITPGAVMLKNWGDNTLCPWDYNGPLGKLVQSQDAKPRLLVNSFREGFNWPWPQRVVLNRIPDWLEIYAL